MRSRENLHRAAVEEFRAALCEYVLGLRASGISRDKIVSAVWPAFTGIGSLHILADAIESRLKTYDTRPTPNGRLGEDPS
jgi:hypothetical protein